MRALVVGHGMYEGDTFVPEGTVLHLHTLVDELGSGPLHVYELSTGGVVGSLSQLHSGETVKNFLMTEDWYNDKVVALTVVPDADELFMIGDRDWPTSMRLCEGGCSGTVHTCTGVLGRLTQPGVSEPAYDEIHIFCCMMDHAERRPDDPVTEIVALDEETDESGTPNTIAGLERFKDDLFRLIEQDPQAAIQYFENTLTEDGRAVLMQFEDIEKWSLSYNARRFMRDQGERGERQFYLFFCGQQDHYQKIYLDDDKLKEAVEKEREYLLGQWRAFRAQPDERLVWWLSQPILVRKDLERFTDIGFWVSADEAGRSAVKEELSEEEKSRAERLKAQARDYRARVGDIAYARYWQTLRAGDQSLLDQEGELKAAVDDVKTTVNAFVSDEMSDTERREAWQEFTDYDRACLADFDQRVRAWLDAENATLGERLTKDAKEYVQREGKYAYARYWSSLGKDSQELLNQNEELKAAVDDVKATVNAFVSDEMSDTERREVWQEFSEDDRVHLTAFDRRISQWARSGQA